jgi:hypothetical protein
MNNKNLIIILCVYFLLLSAIVIIFLNEIDQVIGGFDNCKICIKLHFNGYLTNWSIIHFFVFSIAGFISPENVYFIIIAGTCWEIAELYFEYTSKTNHNHILCRKKVLNCKQNMDKTDFWNHYLGIKEYPSAKYIFCSGGLLGSVMDIIVNIIGVYSGIYIRHLLYK